MNLAAIQFQFLCRRFQFGQSVLVSVENGNDVAERPDGIVVPAGVAARGPAKGPCVGVVEGFEGLPQRFRHVIEAVFDLLGHFVRLFSLGIGIEGREVSLGSEYGIDLFLDRLEGAFEFVLERPDSVESPFDLVLLDHEPLGFGGELGQVPLAVTQDGVEFADALGFFAKGKRIFFELSLEFVEDFFHCQCLVFEGGGFFGSDSSS